MNGWLHTCSYSVKRFPIHYFYHLQCEDNNSYLFRYLDNDIQYSDCLTLIWPSKIIIGNNIILQHNFMGIVLNLQPFDNRVYTIDISDHSTTLIYHTVIPGSLAPIFSEICSAHKHFQLPCAIMSCNILWFSFKTVLQVCGKSIYLLETLYWLKIISLFYI